MRFEEKIELFQTYYFLNLLWTLEVSSAAFVQFTFGSVCWITPIDKVRQSVIASL